MITPTLTCPRPHHPDGALLLDGLLDAASVQHRVHPQHHGHRVVLIAIAIPHRDHDSARNKREEFVMTALEGNSM